jgi:2-amino-4-hydroxy-6-hydroxymethyldihydropteridine diphosphokinase
MADVALALGSNMGDSATILQGAVDDLCAVEGLTLEAVSAVYETDPVGGPDQDAYLNAVVVGRTTLTGPDLLAATQAVETAWHRMRDVRWGPRTLDVDILTLGGEVVDTPSLTIPHPRAHERAFVLVPWCDVAPDAVVPGRGSVAALRQAVDSAGVRATPVVLRLTESGGSA